MARFIFSNNKSFVSKFKDHCVSVGFDRYIEFAETNLSGVVFQKLKIENVNTYKNGNKFISAVGTYFYKKEFAGDALKLIYEDLQKGIPIHEIRNEMDGNFAMVVYSEEKLYALTDALGVHYLYYYEDKETKDWMIGTSLYEMASVLPKPCTCSEFNLLEDCYQYGVWGGDTLFEEFKRVEGDTMCVVDVKKQTMSVKSGMVPLYEINQSSFEELTSAMADDIKGIVSTIGKCFGKENISIFMTGGLDSRMTLSGLLSCDIRPHMYYGVGNSLLTHTKAPDLTIDRMYEKELGLPLTVLDYRNEIPLDKEWDEQLNKYGFLDHFSSVTPNQRRAFESVTEPFVFYGINGEAFRNEMSVLEHAEKENYEIEDVRDTYYILHAEYMNKVFGDRFEEYKSWLKEKQSKTIAAYLNKDGTIPRDFCAAYYLQCMIAHDTHKNNLLNQHRYCMTLGSDYRLMKYALAPAHMKDDAKLIIRVIDKLYPALLDMPFFSRCEYRKYDRNENKMIVHLAKATVECSTPFKSNCLKLYKKIFSAEFRRSFKRLRQFIADPKAYREAAYRESLPKEHIAKELERLIDAYPMFKRNMDIIETSYYPRDAHLALFLRALDKLGIKDLKK